MVPPVNVVDMPIDNAKSQLVRKLKNTIAADRMRVVQPYLYVVFVGSDL